MKNAIALLGLSVLAAACSTGIKVTRVTGDGPVQGNPWNLAMTQFNVTITRHVSSCEKGLEGTVEVIATPAAVLDEDQRYVLESNGWWATSDITSTLAANGTSLGLNATSTDSTQAIVSNVVGTIGQGLVAGAAGPLLTAGAPSCSKEITAVVARLNPTEKGKKGLKQLVDEDIAALAEATAKIVLLTAKSGIDAAFKKDLIGALDAQSTLQKRLADRQRELALAIGLTTHTQTFRWPTRASTFRSDTPFSLDGSVLKKWLAEGTSDQQATGPQFDVHFAIFRPQSAEGGWEAPKPSVFNSTKEGVPVRLARIGRLLACTGSPCPASLPAIGSSDPKHTQFDQVVLQLGQMYTVPLTGGSFRAQTAVVALDASGLPTSIQVAEKAAAGVGLTATLKDTATQIAALPGQVSAAKLASVNAQTSMLTAQTNQLNAQAALETAQANAGVAGQTAPLAAQTALINAQNALATARANAGAQQTLEITAQTAMLNAQAALITAQANARTGSAIGALNAQTSLRIH